MGVIQYTIQPNDNLWLMAQKFNTTVYAIAAVNPGIEVNYIQVGQIMTIPAGFVYYPAASYYINEIPGISRSQVNLINEMRLLWEQHITWTRVAINGIIENSLDLDDTVERLLRNPIDFANILKPFYGDENADIFSDLIKNNLVIVEQLIATAKVGDEKAIDEFDKNWFSNADKIAAFLSSINPFLCKKDWITMLYGYLKMTKSEVINILAKNYSESIDVYDKIEQLALKMADIIVDGIVKQFPDRFYV